jgi:hypothetical protein
LTHVASSRYSTKQILSVAKEAWRRVSVIPWTELDPEDQRAKFDVAVDICEKGAPSPNKYEQMVAQVKEELL